MKEYEKKHKELVKLATSIDLWKQAKKTKEQEKDFNDLMEELEAETFN